MRPVRMARFMPVIVWETDTFRFELRIEQDWPTYHLRVPTVLKYGSLNLLEPSGPVQACNWIALSLRSSTKFWWNLRSSSIDETCSHWFYRQGHDSYISQMLHTLSSPWRSRYIFQMSHRFYNVRMSTNSATWYSNRPHLSPFKPSYTLQLTTIFPSHEILHNFVLTTAALKNLITSNQEVMYEY